MNERDEIDRIIEKKLVGTLQNLLTIEVERLLKGWKQIGAYELVKKINPILQKCNNKCKQILKGASTIT